LLLVLIMALVLTTIQPLRNADACTQPPPNLHVRPPTLAERTETAPYVLLGTAIGIGNYQSDGRIATVKVEAYLKGAAGPQEVKIDGFGGGALCLSGIGSFHDGTPIIPQGTLIIFAEGDPNGRMHAHYSPWRDAAGAPTRIKGDSNATVPASPEILRAVTAAVARGAGATPWPIIVTVTPIPTPADGTPTPTPMVSPTLTPTPSPTPTQTPTPTPTPAPSDASPTPPASGPPTREKPGGCIPGAPTADLGIIALFMLGLVAVRQSQKERWLKARGG
jgi:hypothetical protein